MAIFKLWITVIVAFAALTAIFSSHEIRDFHPISKLVDTVPVPVIAAHWALIISCAFALTRYVFVNEKALDYALHVSSKQPKWSGILPSEYRLAFPTLGLLAAFFGLLAFMPPTQPTRLISLHVIAVIASFGLLCIAVGLSSKVHMITVGQRWHSPSLIPVLPNWIERPIAFGVGILILAACTKAFIKEMAI